MSRLATSATAATVGYFGKVPSRGDFIKGSDNPALIKTLDDWLARAMDLLASDARWKLSYDAMAPLHFAIIGPRRRHAIAGHIVASSDQSILAAIPACSVGFASASAWRRVASRRGLASTPCMPASR